MRDDTYHKRFLVVLAGCLLFGGCLNVRDEAMSSEANACTACHGSATRDASALNQSAPPSDLSGNTDVSAPGVGAHQVHLQASATHGEVACSECHVVPERTDSPGHADTAYPAEISFGTLADHDEWLPAYDVGRKTCSNTYCHRAAEPLWTAPRSSDEACGSCHGLPPPPPHPQSAACSNCHAEVIDENRQFSNPELHVNGSVEVAPEACNTCHGSPENPAPPRDLLGNMARSSIGVGAHQAHLAGGENSRSVACGECHVVPASVNDPEHLDETPSAELLFSGVATTADTLPVWDRETLTCSASWCHGPSLPAQSESPAWTSEAGSLGCTGCHGLPPAPPHPQLENCSLCHGEVVSADLAIVDRTKHVDGMVEVAAPMSCSACHGSTTSAAPPPDLAGNTETTEPGVGAHQQHFTTSIARPVLCSECHLVPESVFDPAHMDTAGPAEVVFSGVATEFGAAPTYNGNTCANTYCHGAMFVRNSPSDGTHTAPIWTQVDGTQTGCRGCHGLPPAAPHPAISSPCSSCHPNIGDDLSFIDPLKHVNGRIDLDIRL